MNRKEIIRDELAYLKFEIEQQAQCTIILTQLVQEEMNVFMQKCGKLENEQFYEKCKEFFQQLNGEIWIEIGMYMSGNIEHGKYLDRIEPPDYEPKKNSLYDVYRHSETFRK